ncbi:hypothetical protein BWQ96_08181 [Gracilariopsis chorda]|uniref:BZIP domain-containing protein n=1 Tax=Gracilariopsis chorda TaxID=448386 RepID=A0A2V3IIZ8_9FLOR|nr:hypothetical protein BWQ96_08181 [Gracilariopsis chorda]|eukprot:PXF42075.1 hypothetical protein BWQ96_08181 [Gracilariopsis chorda]
MEPHSHIPEEVLTQTELEQQLFLDFVDREARRMALRDVPRFAKTGCKWTQEERTRNNKECVRRTRRYKHHRRTLLEDELRKLSLEESRLELQTAQLDQYNVVFPLYTDPLAPHSEQPPYHPSQNHTVWGDESSSTPSVQPYHVQEGELDDAPQPEHSNHNLDYWSQP